MLSHYLVKHNGRKQAISDKLQDNVATYWRNFLSPEFKKKFQREVPLISLKTQCRTGQKKPPCQTPVRSVQRLQ